MLLYASKYHDICAVVNLSGRYNLKRGIKEMLGEDFMEKMNKDGFVDGKNKAGNLQVHAGICIVLIYLSTHLVPGLAPAPYVHGGGLCGLSSARAQTNDLLSTSILSDFFNLVLII